MSSIVGLCLYTSKDVGHWQLPTRCSTLIYVIDITIQLKLVLFAWNKINPLYKRSDAMKGSSFNWGEGRFIIYSDAYLPNIPAVLVRDSLFTL